MRAPAQPARDLVQLDRYGRAAHDRSAAQIDLLDNPLLGEPLEPRHVKPRLLGHWGTTPFDMVVLSHLDRYHLALGVLHRMPGPREKHAAFGRRLSGSLAEHTAYVRGHGAEQPQVRDRKWPFPRGRG